MRTLVVITLTTLMGAAAYGQNAPVGTGKATVIAGIASGDGVVKNSPFSADAVSESVQVLADGNRIVRSTTTKIYRNSEGRIRRELQGGNGNVLGTVYFTSPGIIISDPVLGQRYMLDQELKIARSAELRALPSIRVVTNRPAEVKAADEARSLEEELKANRSVQRQAEANSRLAEELAVAAGSQPRAGVSAIYAGRANEYESRTEQLGTQIIEGVEAEGTRTYTTIPEGAIGNERPIEIVYERWYSKELQMTVNSRHHDPRFGEQTYRLTNIVRSEPDPSLFTVPQGYKITPDPGAAYRIRSTQDAQRKAAEARAASGAARTRP
jgi:hypothetical protein